MSLTMSKSRGKRNPTLLIGAIVFAVAAGLFLAVTGVVVITSKSWKPTEAAVSGGGVASRSPPVIDTDNGIEFMTDFRDNPIAAEKKWIGKRVRIKQRAGDTSKDHKGRYYLWIRCGIAVYPATSELNKFGTVHPWHTVTVETTLTLTKDNKIIGEDSKLIVNHGHVKD